MIASAVVPELDTFVNVHAPRDAVWSMEARITLVSVWQVFIIFAAIRELTTIRADRVHAPLRDRVALVRDQVTLVDILQALCNYSTIQ